MLASVVSSKSGGGVAAGFAARGAIDFVASCAAAADGWARATRVARPCHWVVTGSQMTPASSLRKRAPAVSMARVWWALVTVESVGRWLGRVLRRTARVTWSDAVAVTAAGAAPAFAAEPPDPPPPDLALPAGTPAM